MSCESNTPGDHDVATVYTDVPHWLWTEAERGAGEGAEQDGVDPPGAGQ